MSRWSSRLLSPAVLGAILLAWHLATTQGGVPMYILPRPADVFWFLVAGFAQSPTNVGGLWFHLGVTMAEALLGFVLGSAAGIAIGMALAHSRLLERVFYPYVIAFQSLPKIAIAPLLVIWFGFGMEAKVVVTSIITFFPLLVNSIAGYHAVEPERIELARVCNASRMQIFWKIVLPSSLPFLFAGLNVSAVLALLGALVGEFVGAQAGLGMLLLQYNNNLQVAGTFGVLLILCLCGYLMNAAVRAAEARYCFWGRRPKLFDNTGS
jgi:NitT/TauT family transport system permease protein